MSQIYKNSSGGGGSPIITIDGDTGSITGSTVTIYAHNSTTNSGATVKFVNSGTVSTLDLSDNINNNILLGFQCGNLSMTGTENVGLGLASLLSTTISSENVSIGNGALASLTGPMDGGGSNVAIGFECAGVLLTGTDNVIIGSSAGSAYTGSESLNIIISNAGVIGESNVTRIGTSGDQNTCYISGIVGNTVSNQEFVTINSSTGQLGVTSSAGVSGPGSSTDRAIATWNGTGGSALFNNSTTHIDSTGRMTNSAQPAFLFNNTNNLANVTGDGTQITMTYDNQVFQQGSNFSSSTFTAPITGIYHFDASASFYNLSAATNASGCSVSFYVNGSEFRRFTQINAGLVNDTTDSNTFIAFGSTLIKLNSTDTVNIQGRVFGSTKTVGLEGGQFTSFSGHLVC